MAMVPFGIGTIARTYRHVQRYREIAGVLLKHGFGDLVTRLGLHRHLPFAKRHAGGPPDEPMTRARRIRLALDELGCTFVKLGQFLSTRRDLLSDALIEELENLQDTVTPFPAEKAREIIEQELGKPLERLFRSFRDQPIASASISQVHEAVTLAGEHVVVKVQRPDIVSTVRTDLEIMTQLAGLMERFLEESRVFEPVRTVQYFAGVVKQELDFLAEATHIERFARSFTGDARVKVPAVYRELSTSRVLTMEYITGTKVSDMAALQAQGLAPEDIAAAAAESMFEQVFTHGFFHADPHPGNLLVLPGGVLCFLDYGMMGVLSQRYREQLSNLVLGLVNRDEREIATSVFRLSGYTQYERSEVLEADIADFVEQNLYKPLSDIRIGEVLNDLTRLLILYDIRMPPRFFILTKALTTMDGVVRRLSPQFDVIGHMEPLAKKMLRRRWGLRYLTSEFLFSALEFQNLVRELPADIREIMRLFKRGEVRVKLEHRGLEELLEVHDQVSNRLVFAIVLAALIVGSSIMVLSGIPPKWREIPLIGVIGFVLSGILGFWLLTAILRHRKM